MAVEARKGLAWWVARPGGCGELQGRLHGQAGRAPFGMTLGCPSLLPWQRKPEKDGCADDTAIRRYGGGKRKRCSAYLWSSLATLLLETYDKCGIFLWPWGLHIQYSTRESGSSKNSLGFGSDTTCYNPCSAVSATLSVCKTDKAKSSSQG